MNDIKDNLISSAKLKLLVIISLLVAVFLNMLRLPEYVSLFRPEFFLLVFIYWLLVFPYSIGVGTAWFFGIFLDVLFSSIFGSYTLGFIIVAYLVNKFREQLLMFPMWQQALYITILVFIYKFINIMIMFIGDGFISFSRLFFPILTSFLIWPWLATVLNKYSHNELESR